MSLPIRCRISKKFLSINAFWTPCVKQLLTFLPVEYQINSRQRHSKAITDRSALQVVKPVKVTSLHRNAKKISPKQPVSRFKPRHVQADSHNLPSHMDGDQFEESAYEDHLASTVVRYSSKVSAHNAEAEFTQSLVRSLHNIKRHTIKRKYFKQVPFPNLLTWATKEHIRFLHESDPEHWSFNELSDNFPVSGQALRRILQSERGMYQEQDILQHDRQVLENWNNLHTQVKSGALSDEQLESFLNCFFNAQNECVVSNAVYLANQLSQKERSKPKAKGPISLIVKDCLDIQEKEAKGILEEEIPSVANQLSLKLKKTALLFQKLKVSFEKAKRKNISTRKSNFGIYERAGGKIELPSTDASDLSKNKVNYVNLNNSSNLAKTIKKDAFTPANVIHKTSSSVTYISGKNVYDVSGKFLYRVP